MCSASGSSHRIFAKAGTRREGGPEYVFYEGPPTANGTPGVHHVLARAFKDVFPRYKIMRGYHVVAPRRLGHPRAAGRDRGREAAWASPTRARSRRTASTRSTSCAASRPSSTSRIGSASPTASPSGWTWRTPTSPITNDYIELVWWILKTFWDKGLLYQGYKVVPYCPRCGTPLSDHEVALGYADAERPLGLRAPAAGGRAGHLAAGLDDHPLDAAGQRGRGGASRGGVRHGRARACRRADGSSLILAGALLEKVFRRRAGQGGRLQGQETERQALPARCSPSCRPRSRPITWCWRILSPPRTAPGWCTLRPAFGAEDMQAAHGISTCRC